jgi:hypothetical protein
MPRDILLAFFLTAPSVITAGADAQQERQAQAALQTICRRDVESLCTGAGQALQCLDRHAAAISAGCESRLNEIRTKRNALRGP